MISAKMVAGRNKNNKVRIVMDFLLMEIAVTEKTPYLKINRASQKCRP
jgi:hypothetical protein